MSPHACPACDSYPAAIDAAIDQAGRDHDKAMARIRRGAATERDLPSEATERLVGGATWWADGAPWDAPVVAA